MGTPARTLLRGLPVINTSVVTDRLTKDPTP